MLLPGAAYFIINNYIPMLGIVVAFKKFNYQKGIWGSDFNGLKNFEFLFGSKEAWNITRNAILYNLVFIVLGTLIAVSVAVLLNNIKNKMAKSFYQTVILLPFLISIVVVSYVVYGFLSTQSGFINNAILNGKNISWYSSPKYWPVIIVIVQIWKNFGYNCVIYYATIVGIDSTYYEAAVIDGAGHWQQIKYITLPVIKPTMTILILMSVSKIFYSDFGLFYQVPMNSGPLIDITNTIDTYVYRGLVELNNVGMSAAAGLYQSLVGFILVITANRIVKKYSEESALF
jgi:putative aldouronate transport system permease protein